MTNDFNRNVKVILDELFNTFQNQNEILWLKQLRKEYDNVVFQYNLKTLKAPVFSISDTIQTLGSWDTATRTLSISSFLIKSYRWHQVIDILKHEMAHQIVAEHYLADAIHSKLFQQACELIAVKREFRKAQISLSEPIKSLKDDLNSNPQNSHMRKIEKLLSLAESGNEHEACLAMEKAQELIKTYNVEYVQKTEEKDHVKLTIELNKQKANRTIKIITGILSQYYYVEIMYFNLYNSEHNMSFKAIDIFGTKDNVLIAEYVFHFLQSVVNYLWRDYQKQNDACIAQKLSYQVGLLTGFQNKLRDHDKKISKHYANTANEALIIYQKKALQNFVKSECPKTTSIASSKASIDSKSFTAGCDKGRTIVISKGVTESKNGSLKYLSAPR